MKIQLYFPRADGKPAIYLGTGDGVATVGTVSPSHKDFLAPTKIPEPSAISL